MSKISRLFPGTLLFDRDCKRLLGFVSYITPGQFEMSSREGLVPDSH